MAGSYFCFAFVLSLRGSEALLVDLAPLISSNATGARNQTKAVFIPLLGKVKGEDHSRHHLLASVHTTSSGIPVKMWQEILVQVASAQGRTSGPAFLDPSTGKQDTTGNMTTKLHECLVVVYHRDSHSFPVEITSEASIEERYHAFRSFRRGSVSRATAQGVSEDDRYIVNRWTKKEAGGGTRPSVAIHQHYCDASQCLSNFLRYTQAM